MKPRSLIPAALAAFLAAGCLYVYRLEVPETRTWPADLVAAGFHTLNGSVRITAVPDTTTTALITRRCYGRSRADAEAHIDNVVVTETLADRRLELRVTAPPTGSRSYGASLEVTLPQTAALSVETSNGGITVTGASAGITAGTSNGEIQLTGSAGTADLNTTNGPVTVAVHAGSITIYTSNGPVNCDLALLDATGHARIRTSNSGVTLRLPADASAAFDLETSNGDITITPGFGSVSYTRQERTHKTGSIGSGAAELTVKTSNGDITVLPR